MIKKKNYTAALALCLASALFFCPASGRAADSGDAASITDDSARETSADAASTAKDSDSESDGSGQSSATAGGSSGDEFTGILPASDGSIEDGSYAARILSSALSGDADAALSVTDGQLIVTVTQDGEEYLTLDLGTISSLEEEELEPVTPMAIDKKDGEYSIDVSLEGGSGKATVSSPTVLTVKDGKAYARLEWSSSNYDYMIVGVEKYLPLNEEGNSVFEIPVAVMDEAMPVVADTLAMGDPHEIHYTLHFYSDSIGSKSELPQEAAKRVLAIAFAIIVGGGILNHFVNKKRQG